MVHPMRTLDMMEYDDDFLLSIANSATAPVAVHCPVTGTLAGTATTGTGTNGSDLQGRVSREFLVYFAEETSAKDLLQLQCEAVTVH